MPTVIATGATCQQLLQQGPHANSNCNCYCNSATCQQLLQKEQHTNSYCNRDNRTTVIATGATCQQLLQQGQQANSYCKRSNIPTVIATGTTGQQLLQQGQHANSYCNRDNRPTVIAIGATCYEMKPSGQLQRILFECCRKVRTRSHSSGSVLPNFCCSQTQQSKQFKLLLEWLWNSYPIWAEFALRLECFGPIFKYLFRSPWEGKETRGQRRAEFWIAKNEWKGNDSLMYKGISRLYRKNLWENRCGSGSCLKTGQHSIFVIIRKIIKYYIYVGYLIYWLF